MPRRLALPSPRVPMVATGVLALVASLLLVLGTPMTASAQRPPAPDLTGPAGPVVPGAVVILRGRTRTTSARPLVELEREQAGRWVRDQQVRANRVGRFVLRVRVPEQTRFRVRVGERTSRPVLVRVRPGVRTTTASAPVATTAHTRVPLTATSRPARPGATVVFQRREADGHWHTLGTAVENRTGRASFLVTPEATTTYRVQATGASAATTTVALLARSAKPWVTGYYAGWFWDQEYAPHEVDMSDLSHFVFGRVAPGGGSLDGVPGAVVPGAGSAHDPAASPYPGTTVEDYLVDRAHAAGAKALLMLGGDGFDGRGFVASTTDAVRPVFVRNLVDYLVAHDYDGVDVDWENCLGGEAWECGVRISRDEAVRRLSALVVEVRAEMATRPRYAAQPGLITFPGYPVNTNHLQPGGKVDAWQAEMTWLVDQYNLMSYGIGTTWNRDGWSSWFSGALDDESPATPVSIDSSIDAYVATGAPRDKIGLGIGLYGIYFGPNVTGPRQSTETNEIYETNDVALSYTRLVEMGYLDHGTRRFDADASSTYRTYGGGGYVPPTEPGLPPRNPAGFLSYEDEESIAAKADYVAAGGAGGTIVWTLNYGALPDGSNPLLDAIGRTFLRR
ncbi:glycoside hydrolase family 18 protein [Pimelobacter simplex]|uniref:glycoside hydrolase family 18 protein n=1 Tax=Nocardioides simplex TaxID=2045 RepID=UPI00214FF3FE|nr:glycoside hydrolase family 18 protein [Pimelobacter simplex]UUW90432.1 glycoside hydrolase family 18 protein [Pimelobacter simplex]UUW94262.1 glycoside hydrolase family 18 protein [Pimelobacter simplex]